MEMISVSKDHRFDLKKTSANPYVIIGCQKDWCTTFTLSKHSLLNYRTHSTYRFVMASASVPIKAWMGPSKGAARKTIRFVAMPLPRSPESHREDREWAMVFRDRIHPIPWINGKQELPKRWAIPLEKSKVLTRNIHRSRRTSSSPPSRAGAWKTRPHMSMPQ